MRVQELLLSKNLILNKADNDRRLEKERLEAEQRAAREAEQERLRLLAADKKGKGKGKGAPAPGPAPAPGGKVEIDPVSHVHCYYLFIEGCQVTSGGEAGKWEVNQVLKVRSGEARVQSRVIPGEDRLCEDDTSSSNYIKAVREEDKDPATKAKEKLQQRIDMYKVRCIPVS